MDMGGQPIFASTAKRPLPLTRSKALVRSMKAINSSSFRSLHFPIELGGGRDYEARGAVRGNRERTQPTSPHEHIHQRSALPSISSVEVFRLRLHQTCLAAGQFS